LLLSCTAQGRFPFSFFIPNLNFVLLWARAVLWVNAKRCPQSAPCKLPEKSYKVFTIGLCDKVAVDFFAKCDKVAVDGATKWPWISSRFHSLYPRVFCHSYFLGKDGMGAMRPWIGGSEWCRVIPLSSTPILAPRYWLCTCPSVFRKTRRKSFILL
jgi:hypothetical protein